LLTFYSLGRQAPAPLAPLLLQRVVLGMVVSGAIALAARHSRMLSREGAIAATGVGTVCVMAGWDWAVALIAFFLSGSIWSRIGRVRKEALTADVISKGGERDALQVLANGGVFALCALGYVVWSQPHATDPGLMPGWTDQCWRALAGGALAAASGDTWATEVGTLWGGSPRSILTGRRVRPGTSGGVTAVGTAAGIGGSAAMALVLWALRWGWPVVLAALAGGVVGMILDSVLGATLQRRRWCERCKVPTERGVHSCGAATRADGGLPWLDNDGVNAFSTFAGACTAVIFYRSLL
jgi:uncharacterized protein (TIGR00297 family)